MAAQRRRRAGRPGRGGRHGQLHRPVPDGRRRPRTCPVAALEAAIPDAAALVFACLGIALALHGRRAVRARALNLAAVGTSVFMNAIAAAPGWRNLAIWAMPPVAYALASDTLIGVVRAWAIARTRHWPRAGAETATPLAVARRPGPVAAAPDPGPRLHPGRVPRLGAGGMPGRPRPPRPPARPPPRRPPVEPRDGDECPRKATKTARFLALVAERHGPLAAIPLDRVAADQRRPGPEVGLNPGAARAALRKAVLAAQNGDPR